jgi:hypothetical protein
MAKKPLKKIEKDEVTEKYMKGLVSLEILKVPKEISTVEEAEKLYDDLVETKSYLIDDLSRPYLIRIAYTTNKSKLRSTDPDSIIDADLYELSESIQEISKENNFPVIKSNFPNPDEKDSND